MTFEPPQYREEPWIEAAVCKSIGGEAFFPKPGEDWKAPMNVCLTRCPVRAQCLDYAMRMEIGQDSKTRFGVWAGLSPVKRKKYEKQWLAERESAA